jgi:hypothetical protein
VEAQPQLTAPPAAGGAPAGPDGGPGAAPTRSSALPVGAVRTLFRQTPVALFGNVVGMLLIAFVYGDVAEHWRLAAWYVPTVVLWLLRLLQWLIVGRRSDLDDATVLRQRWRWRLWRWPRAPCGAWRRGCSGAWATRSRRSRCC